MSYSPNFQWKRKTVTIAVPTFSLPAGYQVKLTIPKETEMQPDFRDLRFETTDGYGLPYWIENIVSYTATVWVKLRNAVSSPNTVNIYMYYGNPFIASESSGINVFDFFDDFEDGNYSSNPTWTDVSSAFSVVSEQLSGVTSKRLKSSTHGSAIYSPSTLATDACWEWDFYNQGRDGYGNALQQGFNSFIYIDSNNAASAGASYGVKFWLYIGGVTVFNYDSGSNTIATGILHYKVTRIGDVWTFYVDGVQKAITTTSGLNTSALTKYYSYMSGGLASSYPNRVDNFRYRKLVATEPATPTIDSTAYTVNWNPQRKAITINTTTATPANYQVKITVPFAPEMNNDFSDLRFVSKTNVPLDYWIESSTLGVTANIWVELADSIGTSSSDYIYMHYGNPNLTSVSNGVNVFDLFDDFLGTLLDTSKWTSASPYANGTITVANSVITLAGDGSGYREIHSVSNYGTNFVVRSKFKFSSYQNSQIGFGTLGTYNVDSAILNFSGTPTKNFTTIKTNTTQNSTITGDFTVYNTVEIRRNSTTSAIYYLNDVLDTTNSTQVPTVSLNVYAMAYTNSILIDWILVRKYVATEPTIDQTAVVESVNTFSNRKILIINNNSGGVLTDYQVPITVTYESAMQSNFNDIRFVDTNGNLLPCWLESKTDSSTAKFWIKVDLPSYGTSPTGDNTVYMYYGNPNLASASDGPNTFIDFSDFVDLTGWTQQSGTWTVASGILNSPTTVVANHLRRNTTIADSSYIINLKAKVNANPRMVLMAEADNPLLASAGASVALSLQSDYHIVYCFVNGTGPSVAATLITGTWYIGELKIQAGANVASRYLAGWTDKQSVTNTGTSTGTGHYWGFYANGDNFSVDWIFVRKYAATEPTVALFADQDNVIYAYRKPITINNTTNANTLTNYQILVTVDTSDTSRFHNSGADIRFTSGSSSYNEQNWSISYPYWIESGSGTSTTKIWVKIDSIGASSTKTIYMYYGNSSAIAASSGTNTFDFFDDFPGSSLDTNKWTITGTGYTVSGSELALTSGADTFLYGKTLVPRPAIKEAKIRTSSTIPNLIQLIYLVGTLGTNDIGGYGINSTNVMRTFTRSGSVITGTNDDTISDFTATHIYKLVWTSSAVSFYQDSTNFRTYTTNIPSVNMGDYYGGNTGGSGTAYIDWTRIRKYTSTEPSTSLGSEVVATGSLDISSTPTGAEIFIDTVDQSVTTPRVITGLSTGSHSYKLTLSGYEDYTGSLTINPDTTTTLSLTMLSASIGATSMTITPSETPCRIGICSVTVNVTWHNNGLRATFTPSITIDGTPHSLSAESLAANGTISHEFIISGLSAGTHPICPNPN